NILENNKFNSTYYYKLVNPAYSIIEKNDYPSGVNLKDFIMGNATMSHINLSKGKFFNDHVNQLSELHNEINHNFNLYYRKLARNKQVTSNKKRLNKLSQVVKKDRKSTRLNSSHVSISY